MLAEGRPKRMNRTAAFVDVATGAVDPSSWTEPEECPVSLKQLSLESPMLYIIPRAGTCGHLFHDDGLVGEHTQGLLRLKRCPLCRAEIAAWGQVGRLRTGGRTREDYMRSVTDLQAAISDSKDADVDWFLHSLYYVSGRTCPEVSDVVERSNMVLFSQHWSNVDFYPSVQYLHGFARHIRASKPALMDKLQAAFDSMLDTIVDYAFITDFDIAKACAVIQENKPKHVIPVVALVSAMGWSFGGDGLAACMRPLVGATDGTQLNTPTSMSRETRRCVRIIKNMSAYQAIGKIYMPELNVCRRILQLDTFMPDGFTKRKRDACAGAIAEMQKIITKADVDRKDLWWFIFNFDPDDKLGIIKTQATQGISAIRQKIDQLHLSIVQKRADVEERASKRAKAPAT